MTDRDFDPLFGDAREEIPLANAPLVSVVAQVQFTPILQIRSEDYVASFQEQIRSSYPDVQQEKFPIFPMFGGETDIKTEIIWRFTSSKTASRLSLAPTFLALETMVYTSRADFMERFKLAVAALKTTVQTARVSRIGIRYVDRIKLPELDGLAEMLRPEMYGLIGTRLESNTKHCVSELFCEVAEGDMLAKWGLLPPHGTHDPNVLRAIDSRSWFLDVDVSKQYAEPLDDIDPETIHSIAFALATRCYTFFRWATTPKFLEAFGGQK